MDQHVAVILTDLVDDSVIPPTSCVQTFQIESQGLAHPIWLQCERGVDELDDRRADFLGEATQRLRCGRGPRHFPGGHAPVPSIANASFLSRVTAASVSAREART